MKNIYMQSSTVEENYLICVHVTIMTRQPILKKPWVDAKAHSTVIFPQISRILPIILSSKYGFRK